MTSPTDLAIRTQNLRKTFGPKLAVDNVSLEIARGELIGLIGPNGAGKTTTIRMMMSILFPDTGSIEVLGLRSALLAKDRIGYLPEERGVYRKMRVGRFLEYMATLKGVAPGPSLSDRVDHWLERVGLADCRRKRCEELSKGMQQKVQFVATVLHEPELLILDEPLSGLDPVNSRLMRELFLEQHRQGRTLIFSTHQMFAAEQVCDRILMISRGQLVLDDTMRAIRAREKSRSVLVDLMEHDEGSIAAAQSVLDGRRTVASVRRGGIEDRCDLVAEIAAQVDPVDALRDIASSLPARRVELKAVTLEDVFIGLAGDHPSDDAAEMPQHASNGFDTDAHAKGRGRLFWRK